MFDLTGKPGSRRSISFSIAYVRVCEWAREPETYVRPKLDILEKARVHAQSMDDRYILDKIDDCRRYYSKVDSTPTPKRPKPTATAKQVTLDLDRKIRQFTQPYSISQLSEDEKMNLELDIFLSELEE